MNEKHDDKQERLDQATSRRLAKLGQRPVDTAALERRLEPLWSRPQPSTRTYAWWRQARPPLAAAAAIGMLVLVGWLVFHTATAPAIAEPAEVSQLHHQMLTSHLDVEPVEDIEAANRVIAEQWVDAPRLPDVSLPARGCCLHQLGGKRVAAVQLDHPAGDVTMAVARSRDLTIPEGREVEHGGQRLTVHDHGGVTMVMARHEGRWLCVMGELPEQELIEIASRVVF